MDSFFVYSPTSYIKCSRSMRSAVHNRPGSCSRFWTKMKMVRRSDWAVRSSLAWLRCVCLVERVFILHHREAAKHSVADLSRTFLSYTSLIGHSYYPHFQASIHAHHPHRTQHHISSRLHSTCIQSTHPSSRTSCLHSVYVFRNHICITSALPSHHTRQEAGPQRGR